MEEKVLNIVLEKRFRRKIDSAVTAGKNTLIVFFKDGKTKKCNIKKIAGGDRGYAILEANEDYIDGILRVHNNPICDVIDNYNCSAFYEPSYVIARAYQNGGF